MLCLRTASLRRRIATSYVEDLVEPHQVDYQAHSACRGNHNQSATERLDPVVRMYQPAGPRRVHERQAADVEPKLSALTVESVGYRMFQGWRACNVQSPVTYRVSAVPFWPSRTAKRAPAMTEPPMRGYHPTDAQPRGMAPTGASTLNPQARRCCRDGGPPTV
jgi:hypothetical protein